jgi:sodium transport system permease protein
MAMKLHNIATVYRKEVRDLTRDRRTMMSMLLWPLVFFPLMTVGIGSLSQKAVEKAEKQSARIVLVGAESAPELAARLKSTEGLEVVSSAGDYKEEIGRKEIQAAVEFPPAFEEKTKNGQEPPRIQIDYYETQIRSEAAADRVDDAIKKYREEVSSARLSARGVTPTLLRPVKVEEKNVASPQKVAGGALGAMLPYFIVLLCFVGGMSAAIDIGAGEKERGTMETVLASSVGRSELAVGKLLTIVTATLFSASASILSFVMTLHFAKGYAQQMTHGQNFTVAPLAIAMVLVIVFPLAVLFSSTLLAVSVFSKSFKEAQSNAGFLIFLVIIPSIASFLPGIDLNTKLALIPILNVSLVAKELFTGSFPWGPILMTLVSNCVYAGVMLAFAVRLFQRESVLFRT